MSTSKLLSQEEIDALMSKKAQASGKPQPKQRQNVSVYDFRHPDRVSKEQMRTLRTIHDRFARTFATYLSNTLRTMIDIKVDTIDQVTYSEYSMSVSVPSCLFISNLSALNGNCIIEIPPNLFFFLIDRLLGGSGKVVDSHREVTVIEQKVMEKIIVRGLKEFEEAWHDITPVRPKLVSFETNPQFVQIAPASETVIVILFDVLIGERTYAMNICIPFIVLEKIIGKLNIHSYIALTQKKQTPEIRQNIERNIEKANVPIQVILGKTNVSVEEFLNLGVGDVIVSDNRIDKEVPVLVSRKQKFWGRPGMVKKSLAVQITQKHDVDEEDQEREMTEEELALILEQQAASESEQEQEEEAVQEENIE